MSKKDEIRYSISPNGEKYEIPNPEDYAKEYERLEKSVNQARKEGKEIVVVMGVGFVGAVMAAIVADTRDANGQASKFVIDVNVHIVIVFL